MSQLPASRILVIRYRFIGDTILTAPFLRNLRQEYKNAQIDVLVGPESGSVLLGCPYIDNLIVFDTTRFHKYDSGQGSPKNFISYAFELRKQNYDLVFVLKRSWSSGLLSWLTGARFRVGYNTEGRRMFLTHPVFWDKHIHEVESTLDLLRAADIPIADDHLETWISEKEENEILELVPEVKAKNTKVLIHAAAAHPDKMYPLEHWAYIVKRLHKDFGITPFYTGSLIDHPLYNKLEELSGIEGINLAGKLSLRQSMALYKHMQMSLCVDSGPAHLTAASGVTTISLFGPTDPIRWRPWGKEHIAVYDPSSINKPCKFHLPCKIEQCLAKLDPELVLAQCQAVMSQQGILTVG